MEMRRPVWPVSSGASSCVLLLGLLLLSLLQASSCDEESSLQTNLIEKRAAAPLYSFGLGKRDDETVEDDVLDYDSIEKRDRGRYNFGLGKRANRERSLYSFGLGKRDRHRFNFGIGKRAFDFEDFMKRRYNFGLGKRSVPYTGDIVRRRRSSDQ